MGVRQSGYIYLYMFEGKKSGKVRRTRPTVSRGEGGARGAVIDRNPRRRRSGPRGPPSAVRDGDDPPLGLPKHTSRDASLYLLYCLKSFKDKYVLHTTPTYFYYPVVFTIVVNSTRVTVYTIHTFFL